MGHCRCMKKFLAVSAVVAVVGGGAVVLAATQPWRVFIDDVVNEQNPFAAVETPEQPDVEPLVGEVVEPVETLGVATWATGTFISLDKNTSGQATIYEGGDGRRFLGLENFETTNGPDLYVYLSAAGEDADTAQLKENHLDLGRLKGNIGNQYYEIPSETDLNQYGTVWIWCERFTSPFGVATLNR